MTTLREIRARAQRAVKESGIDAVVLFGSRARGDAREDSDWDLAAISPHGQKKWTRARAAFEGLDAVEMIALTPHQIGKYRHRSARVESTVAHEGVLLAGTWHKPPRNRRELTMTSEELVHELKKITNEIAGAMNTRCRMALAGESYGPKLVKESQRAAEYLGKAIVMSFSRKAQGGHNLKKIGGLLLEDPKEGKKPHDDATTLGVRRAFASRIGCLNQTKDLHTAEYVLREVEPLSRTCTRIADTMELHLDWLSWYVQHNATARRTMAGLQASIAAAKTTVEVQPSLSKTGPLQHVFASWVQRQQALLQHCARTEDDPGTRGQAGDKNAGENRPTR